jgi:hypothetical protein
MSRHIIPAKASSLTVTVGTDRLKGYFVEVDDAFRDRQRQRVLDATSPWLEELEKQLASYAVIPELVKESLPAELGADLGANLIVDHRPYENWNFNVDRIDANVYDVYFDFQSDRRVCTSIHAPTPAQAMLAIFDPHGQLKSRSFVCALVDEFGGFERA